MGTGVLKAKGQIEVTAADGKTQLVEGKHIILLQVAVAVSCQILNKMEKK